MQRFYIVTSNIIADRNVAPTDGVFTERQEAIDHATDLVKSDTSQSYLVFQSIGLITADSKLAEDTRAVNSAVNFGNVSPHGDTEELN